MSVFSLVEYRICTFNLWLHLLPLFYLFKYINTKTLFISLYETKVQTIYEYKIFKIMIFCEISSWRWSRIVAIWIQTIFRKVSYDNGVNNRLAIGKLHVFIKVSFWSATTLKLLSISYFVLRFKKDFKISFSGKKQ